MRQVYGQTQSYHEKIADERRKRFFVRFSVFFTISILIIGGIIYAGFFANIFDIKTVTIDGVESVAVQDVKSQVESLITTDGLLNTQKHVLFFDENNLKEHLLSLFPVFNSVSIERNPPHEIIVHVKEREAIGIWCFEGNDCSFFDDEGAIWGQALPSTGPLLLTVIDGQARSDISNNLVSHVKDIYEMLPKTEIQIGTIEVRYGLGEDIRVNTKDGWYILMTTNYSIKEQVSNLKVILGQLEENSKVQYIDLRIQGRAYYK